MATATFSTLRAAWWRPNTRFDIRVTPEDRSFVTAEEQIGELLRNVTGSITREYKYQIDDFTAAREFTVEAGANHPAQEVLVYFTIRDPSDLETYRATAEKHPFVASARRVTRGIEIAFSPAAPSNKREAYQALADVYASLTP